MESELFVKKIRKYSIISLLLPLIVINSCFILYKFLGDTETYFGLKYWDTSINEYLVDETNTPYSSRRASAFNNLTDCPKYHYKFYYKTSTNH